MPAFLIDASLPRTTGDVIRAEGRPAIDVRDIGMGTATDTEIADHARQHRLAIVTADQDFGNISQFAPDDFVGIVVVRPPNRAITALVLSLIKDFLKDSQVLAHLPGHLVIVESGRLRVRPPI